MTSPSPTPSKRPAKPVTVRRERGPAYPQQKPNGRWLAESYMPHRSRYLRTFHKDEAKAHKRLDGCPLHTLKKVADTQPHKRGA